MVEGIAGRRADAQEIPEGTACRRAKEVVRGIDDEGASASEERRYTAVDVMLACASETSYTVQCIVDQEIGHAVTRAGRRYEPYDPYMPGVLGEMGPVQLLPRGGLADEFRRRVGPGADPYSPFQALPFLRMLVLEGRGSNWSPWRMCL